LRLGWGWFLNKGSGGRERWATGHFLHKALDDSRSGNSKGNEWI